MYCAFQIKNILNAKSFEKVKERELNWQEAQRGGHNFGPGGNPRQKDVIRSQGSEGTQPTGWLCSLNLLNSQNFLYNFVPNAKIFASRFPNFPCLMEIIREMLITMNSSTK